MPNRAIPGTPFRLGTRTSLKWRVEPLPLNPCAACGGSGSQWKLRADGQPDRRYSFPIGPCPRCNGTREEPCVLCGARPTGRCDLPDNEDTVVLAQGELERLERDGALKALHIEWVGSPAAALQGADVSIGHGVVVELATMTDGPPHEFGVWGVRIDGVLYREPRDLTAERLQPGEFRDLIERAVMREGSPA